MTNNMTKKEEQLVENIIISEIKELIATADLSECLTINGDGGYVFKMIINQDYCECDISEKLTSLK